MLITKASIIVKTLALMPFPVIEKNILYKCSFPEKTIKKLDSCIIDYYPDKHSELVIYKGLDGQTCAFFPYRPTVRYYGERLDKAKDPCFKIPNGK